MNPFFQKLTRSQQHIFSIFFSLLCMGISTVISFLYYHIVPNNSANIALIYILALVSYPDIPEDIYTASSVVCFLLCVLTIYLPILILQLISL